MKFNSTPPIGALHPVLFFVVVYFVSLVLAIFICSSIFYSCNSSSVSTFKELPQSHTASIVTTKVVPNQTVVN